MKTDHDKTVIVVEALLRAAARDLLLCSSVAADDAFYKVDEARTELRKLRPPVEPS